MIISVINLTHDKISDEEVHATIRVVNRPIRDDFEPYDQPIYVDQQNWSPRTLDT